ncbi:3'(2'),5'-bisphosphate nucleotidase/inositol-1,4-bisphosphate 1-phosphatase [Taphrina deformans PYCC 5710]|uniref:3'(2'),5'-bisphosphate nucleotidase n=1 Tax=Taphrina deformans (strain PYCC 5710 / ATCC 11124 / CBS 356.35 / IMI 108563 / JCM 9778 / NBRC 8474) TaxID=1097556 RepID=R4X847_TAPDE|nr:3'(2'),5'-bisphosphate nucleotidase/inositol-1,4-bisphosphate 1-phosphatase [Taphrina deformans PYCC 5710]|eukprot:CCG81689.1 3'(2'),5'-bisphosphate nucleotidase/inositol-1,4-bisphosphate 1-phosphatase [Taphrina deformans PYCC 5710]
MTSLMYLKELKLAELAVARASKLTTLVFQNLVAASTVTKEDKSPVTVADFGAQAIVNAVLHQAFPQIPIVGEEDADALRQDAAVSSKVWSLVSDVLSREAGTDDDGQGVGRIASQEDMLSAIDLGTFGGSPSGLMWALDPIDGTKGFLRGGQYAVCLGLIKDAKVVLGVIGCPNLPVDPAQPDGRKGLLFSAVTGCGAFSQPLDRSETERRISMNTLSSTSEATFCESVEAGHSAHGTNHEIADRLGITRDSVRMDSQAKYCSIARGDGDIYLRLPVSDTYEEKIWDHAAGNVLITEAGGRVSDMYGQELDFGKGRTLKSKGVIACEASIFDQVIAAVKEASKPVL